MKRFIVAAVTVFCAGATAQAGRIAVSELLSPGEHVAERVEFSVEPPLKPLFDRFSTALKDKALVAELMSREKPGEGLPYDPRLGMSAADYRRLRAGLERMTLAPTGAARFSVKRLEGYRMIKSDSCLVLSQGVAIIDGTDALSLDGKMMIPPTYFQNRKTPVAPNDGYQWTRIISDPPAKYEITVSRLLGKNYCLLTCDLTVGGNKPGRESVMLRYQCAP